MFTYPLQCWSELLLLHHGFWLDGLTKGGCPRTRCPPGQLFLGPHVPLGHLVLGRCAPLRTSLGTRPSENRKEGLGDRLVSKCTERNV